MIIAPINSKVRPYPTLVACQFYGKAGQIVLDQIRTVDQRRLIKKLGKITKLEQQSVLATLVELFAE